MDLMGSSLDWTWPREESVSFKIHQLKLAKTEMQRKKIGGKKPNKQTLEHSRTVGQFLKM